jgi:hypothetical protein
MHGLTGGDWKRAANCGNAPVPDPPTYVNAYPRVVLTSQEVYTQIASARGTIYPLLSSRPSLAHLFDAVGYTLDLRRIVPGVWLVEVELAGQVSSGQLRGCYQPQLELADQFVADSESFGD